MKIAIDARWIFPEISGIGEYTRELVRAIAELDGKNAYLLLFDRADLRDRTVAEAGLGGKGNFATRVLPYSVFSLRNQVMLPRLLARDGIALFHAPNYLIPMPAFPRRRRGRTACVVTIHDVIPMIFPNHAPRSRKARLYPIYRRIMVETGARADTVITDSRASRRDVLKHLRIPDQDAGKVQAVYCGVSPRFSPGPGQEQPRPGPRRLLYVGRLDPYKNLATLLRAFAAVRATCPLPLRLTVAGSQDARYPEAPRLARALGIDDAVDWSGYVSDDDLVATYRRADLLVHPSRYEGFGLQVVEAMACGTPVVCSRAGSLPEVAGDAARLVDPDDVGAFTTAILEVLTDASLAREMSRRGLARAREFTWERTARETLAVYAAAAGTHDGSTAGDRR